MKERKASPDNSKVVITRLACKYSCPNLTALNWVYQQGLLCQPTLQWGVWKTKPKCWKETLWKGLEWVQTRWERSGALELKARFSLNPSGPGWWKLLWSLAPLVVLESSLKLRLCLIEQLRSISLVQFVPCSPGLKPKVLLGSSWWCLNISPHVSACIYLIFW